ncbi:MAG: hypothetical protein ACRCW2_09905 [Cellulosilyticaceae bacterium]
MSFYDHPAFNGIDRNFLKSLDQTMGSLSHTKDTTQIIAALMAVSNEAKKYNVNMSPAQQQALITHLRDYLPPDKRPQFDMFIAMMNTNK